ncbi:unnamed protein product [Prorocentrum cordatum]|uniref:Amino acid transporter transmembrane domain-containing protein n=1 Tax=Prorocentrum cordatum TaxID=2364126 RepID=A0ABN9RCU7_9DINO|nr:unnamed protein product [Polarella glacialis]
MSQDDSLGARVQSRRNSRELEVGIHSALTESGKVSRRSSKELEEASLLKESREPGKKLSYGSALSWKSREPRRHTTHNEDYLRSVAETWTPESSRGTAGFWVVVISAFANIGPVGVLVVSRPAGGIVVSLLFFLVFGLLSFFGASLVGGAMQLSGCNTLAEIWQTTIGRRTAWIPTVCTALTCFSICIGYAGLSGHMLADALSANPFPQVFSSSENYWVVLIAVFPLSFLVMLKDVSQMWYSTVVVGSSTLFFVVVVVVRFFDASYEPGNEFIDKHQWIDRVHSKWQNLYCYHEHGVQLLSIQSVLLLMHFNAAKYFRELSGSHKHLFSAGVGLAMGMGFLAVAVTMVICFLTFGDTAHLITLDNYASNDQLAVAARVALSVGLAGCFPLIFAAMREALVELLASMMPEWDFAFSKVAFQNVLSLFLLTAVVLTSTSAHKIDAMAVNFGRTTAGTLLIYVIPAVLWVSTHRTFVASKMRAHQTAGAVVLVAVGVSLAVLSPVVWLTRIDSRFGSMGPPDVSGAEAQALHDRSNHSQWW